MYIETMEKMFVHAYLVCALWSSTDGDDPLDDNYGLEDIEADTRSKMEAEAAKFFNDNIELINRTPEGYGYDNAGHDLWLTRAGHGAGFWDGDAGEVGDELTKLADKLGNQDLYVGDDNKIYKSP